MPTGAVALPSGIIARLALLLASTALAVSAAAPAQALPDHPDLTITLPSEPYAGQVAPVYVDAFEVPGRVLYRFDAVIHNEGGTLDLFRDEGTGEVMQAVWPGGQPTTAPDPEEPPPSGTPVSARGASGAKFEYVFEHTHDHWHFYSAARYELEVPGAATRVADKIGFCLFDSFDTDGVSQWFPADPPGAGTWCHFSAPASSFVRMGLSHGAADRYASQREFQYVDMTGLAPGEYRLRAIANPAGNVLEADGVPDVREATRVVPGVRAGDVTAQTVPGAPVTIQLAGAAVGSDIPARLGADCEPRATSTDCYRWTSPGDPLAYAVASAPGHGTVSLSGSRATYTPAVGFEGSDRFTYTATDARRLTSTPAAVEIRVTAPQAGEPVTATSGLTPNLAPVTTAATARTRSGRLVRITAARLTRGRTLAVRIRCATTADTGCAGVVTARLAGRRIGRARYSGLARGRTRTVRLRLSRETGLRSTRRRLVLSATVRDATGPAAAARRSFQPRSLTRGG